MQVFSRIDAIMAPFNLVWRHRAILLRTTMVEVRSTYAGSVAGLAWVFIGPLLMLAIYALVYAVIFRVRLVDMTVSQYVIYVFCGLVPFLAFALSLTNGTLSLSSNRTLLLNTVFPAELIPVRSVLVGSTGLFTGTVILFVSDAVFSKLSITFLAIPLVVFFQLLFTIGVCWMLSLMALLVRDIQQLLSYVTMLLLIITPIAYTPDMIPAQLKILMYLNPLYYSVTSFQYLIILDRAPPGEVVVIGIMLSLSLFFLGYHVARKTKQVFYDLA